MNKRKPGRRIADAGRICLLSALICFPMGMAGESRASAEETQTLPFALKDVTLHESLFTKNRDKTIAYLKFLDVDRLLHSFRRAAGLPSHAKACGGWEKPDCKLRGHSLGHVMSALGQAYAGSRDPELIRKLDYIVSELAKCQNALPARGNPPGFLSAYGIEQFNQLEALTTYPSIWAPYYTLHKILAGLIAAYRLAGNEKAMKVAVKIADWVFLQLRDVPDSRLQQMWDLYIAGEYGGMNEALAELYDITGKKKYLATAVQFDKKRLLDQLAENRDKLSGLHANQHIPQVIGYLRVYDMMRDPRYLNAACNFWQMVTLHHIYINGGVSDGEMFKDPDRVASFITDKTCETCCAYNMLKLSRRLFCHDPRAEYMDYYERVLYNQILASQDPNAAHTAVTYFMPLNPGGRKTYSNDYDEFTCCPGTGMENHTKYQDSIYFHSRDNGVMYVNLFIPSTLNWREKGVKIIQETRFPERGESLLTIHGEGEFQLKVRVPYWVKRDFTIRINGRNSDVAWRPGTYATLDRKWHDGDKVALSMPFHPRLERLPDIPDIAGIMMGPILLVGHAATWPSIMPDRPKMSAPASACASAMRA